MTAAQFLDWITLASMILLAIALLIAMVRIAIGPTITDRVLALDLLTMVAMGFIAAFAIRTGLTLYLDIAIALALVGFLATVAFARYMFLRGRGSER